MTNLRTSQIDAVMLDHDPARAGRFATGTERADAILRQVLDAPAASLPLDRERPLRNRRRRVLAPLGGIAAIAAATLLIVSLLGTTVPPKSSGSHVISGTSHNPPPVRAKLLAALSANGNDMLEVQQVSTSDNPSADTCTSTQWFSPFDVLSGQPFEEHVKSTCSDGSALESQITIPDPLVTQLATSVPSVEPGTATPSTFFTGQFGASVCGVGTTTGYGTGFASGNGTWDASSVTMTARADATPNLLESEIAAGVLTDIGNTTVNGQPAIELSVTPPAGQEVASNWGSETLWVDPTTYLPIQQVMAFTAESVPAGATQPPPTPSYGGTLTHQFTFLPPTPSNLAMLQISLPSGLPQVPAPQVLPAGACSVLAGR